MILTAALFDLRHPETRDLVLGSGWHLSADSVLSAGTASLTLPAPSAATPAGYHDVIEVRLDPQLHRAVTRHITVELSFAAKTALSARRFGGPCAVQILVPADAVQNGKLPVSLCVKAPSSGAATVKLIEIRWLHVKNIASPASQWTQIPWLRFGWNEPTADLLKTGFGLPEDRYAWSIGGHSAFTLPWGAPAEPFMLLLHLKPYQPGQGETRQRLLIGAGSYQIGFADLRTELFLALNGPSAPSPAAIEISLDNFDANYEVTDKKFHFGKPFANMLFGAGTCPMPPGAKPLALPPIPGFLADASLDANVTARTGRQVAEIISLYEGFGNGCVIPSVQKLYGDQRPGLLRFASWRQPCLITALQDGFSCIGRSEKYKWAVRLPEDIEWSVIDDNYGIGYLTPYRRHQPPPSEDQFPMLARLLSRMAEKLLDQIATGDKIFIFQMWEDMAGATAEAAAMALWAALRLWGDARILWLVVSDTHPSGAVERLSNGLVRGYIPRLTGARVQEAAISCLANTAMIYQV
jgi:hypothetical protein